MRNLQTKYIAAVKWSNETGQGLKEANGPKSFDEAIKKMCPYFEYANQIWGTKASIHIPHSFETTEIGGPDSEGSPVYFDEDSLAEAELIFGEVDEPEATTSQQNVTAPGTKHKRHCPKTAKTAYDELLLQREQHAAEKLTIKKEEIQLTKVQIAAKMDNDRQKLEFEKNKWDAEVRLREQELELKRFEIEKEIKMKELDNERIRLEKNV